MDIEKPTEGAREKTAIIALTRKGTELAVRLRGLIPDSSLYCGSRYAPAGAAGFTKVSAAMREAWSSCEAIVCIMAAGIAVRTIAPLLDKKTADPAVVVVDEAGRFAISLVSGHLGGANELAARVAALLGAQAVITTATDIRGKPSIDLIAKQAGLEIENPDRLSGISSAVLDDERIWVYDPLQLFLPRMPSVDQFDVLPRHVVERAGPGVLKLLLNGPGIWVSETLQPSRVKCLILRPRNLVVGVGCNRDTESAEIIALVFRVFMQAGLSLLSIRNLASIELKSDEGGLLEAAERLGRPVVFGSAEELSKVAVPNPSEVVEKHTGVAGVCEASALWSAQAKELIVPKTRSANCTVAIARAGSPS